MTERRFPILDEGFALDDELDGDLPRVLANLSPEAEARHRPAVAEGRIDVGRVTFEETRREYLASNPPETRDRHRPPYEWSATDREMYEVANWTEERLSALDRVRRDNTRKFLETYAAHRNKEVSRLQAPTAARGGAFRREEESNIRWLTGPGELERAQTGAAPPQVGGGPSPAPARPLPPVPSVLGAPRGPPPIPGEPPEEASLRAEMEDQVERQAREATHTLDRRNERMRLARISGWLERPEILGVQGLSAEFYGHVESAFVDLKEKLPQFADVPDMNALAGTGTTEVRNLFARLAAHMAAVTDFFHAPVTSLDRNKARLDAMIGEIYARLNRWKYDRDRGDFEKRGEWDLREEFEAGMALPPAFAPRERLYSARTRRVHSRFRSARRLMP